MSSASAISCIEIICSFSSAPSSAGPAFFAMKASICSSWPMVPSGVPSRMGSSPQGVSGFSAAQPPGSYAVPNLPTCRHTQSLRKHPWTSGSSDPSRTTCDVPAERLLVTCPLEPAVLKGHGRRDLGP